MRGCEPGVQTDVSRMPVYGDKVGVYLAKAQWERGKVVEDEIRESLKPGKCKI